MPPVFAFIAEAVTYIAVEAQAAAFAAASGFGASAAVATGIASAAFTATEVGLVVGGLYGLNAALAPSIPQPEAGTQDIKQPIPPRRVGLGTARLGGYFMLDEAAGPVLHRVFAMAEGPASSIVGWYLNDDVVTVDGAGVVLTGTNGLYATTKLEYRLGLATETAYADPVSEIPSTWSASHRGDGVVSIYNRCQNGKLDKFPSQFPNGKPTPNAVVVFPCYDWRDGTQDRADPTTWKPSTNPIVWHVHDLWYRRGKDWDKRFSPVLSILTAEANYCDDAVAKVGGTEPRYALGGGFYEPSVTASGDVDQMFLAVYDGFLAEQGDGSIVMRAGRYDAPGDLETFADAAIRSIDLTRYVPEDQACNWLDVSFTSPANAYKQTPLDPWLDQDDIDARGKQLAQPFYPSWVYSFPQARRLAKRKMARLASQVRGTLTTDLTGFKAIGKRYLKITSDRAGFLNALVIEVTGAPSIDWASLSVSFPFVAANVDIDAWDPDTEEGAAPGTPSRIAPDPLGAPVIDSATLFVDAGGDTRIATKVDSPPARTDLIWFARWRLYSGGSWNQAQYNDVDAGPPVELDVGPVPVSTDLDVSVAYQTGGGTLSDWSTPPTFVSGGLPTHLLTEAGDTLVTEAGDKLKTES